VLVVLKDVDEISREIPGYKKKSRDLFNLLVLVEEIVDTQLY
jgi:hypothetical protein